MRKFPGIDFSIEREDVVRGGKFILGAALIFAILSILFSLIPVEIFENFFASISLFILRLLGIPGDIVQGEPVLILLHNYGFPIAISYMCTGIMELLILVSVIGASFGIGIKEKTAGIIAAVAAVISFNTFRIVATIIILLNMDLELAELSHNLLFRVFLFIVIAGFYWAWFGWAAGRKTAAGKGQNLKKRKNPIGNFKY